MSRIIKSSQYEETRLTADGVRVLRTIDGAGRIGGAGGVGSAGGDGGVGLSGPDVVGSDGFGPGSAASGGHVLSTRVTVPSGTAEESPPVCAGSFSARSSAAPTVPGFQRRLGLTLEEWQEQVDKMILETDAQCKRLVSEAEADIQRRKAAAEKDGYEAGLAKGIEDGLRQGIESAERQWRDQLETFHSIIAELVSLRGEAIRQCENDLIDLVIETAGKVIASEVERDDQVVLRVIRKCLDKASAPTSLRIRVNEADLDVVMKARQDLTSRYDTVESVEVVADPSVERGGCLVETGSGSFDGRIDRQLGAIRNAMKAGQGSV